jgi:hypothetical protein
MHRAARRCVNVPDAYLRDGLAAFTMGYYYKQDSPVKEDNLSAGTCLLLAFCGLVLAMVASTCSFAVASGAV